MSQIKGKESDFYGIEIDKIDTFVAASTPETFTLNSNIESKVGLVVSVKPSGGTEFTEVADSDIDLNISTNEITISNLVIDDNVKVEYKGWSTNFTGEVMSNTDGTTYKKYQITDTTKRILDIFRPFTVYVDGVVQSKDDYEVNPFTGEITFVTALVGTETVTCDGAFVKIIQIGTLYSYEISFAPEKVDGTTFRQDFKNEVPIYPTFNGSIEGYHVDEYFAQYIEQDNKAYIGKFFIGQTGMYYIGWFHMDISINSSKDDLVKESISFQGYRGLEKIMP